MLTLFDVLRITSTKIGTIANNGEEHFTQSTLNHNLPRRANVRSGLTYYFEIFYVRRFIVRLHYRPDRVFQKADILIYFE